MNDPVTGAPLADATFRSDELESFEAGIKAETADRSFSVDLAVYHIDWKDIQISTAAGGVSLIANAGGAKVTGAEVTLAARPSRSFTATAGFAWQHARLADDSAELGAPKGDRLPNVPRISAPASLDTVADSAWRASNCRLHFRHQCVCGLARRRSISASSPPCCWPNKANFRSTIRPTNIFRSFHRATSAHCD